MFRNDDQIVARSGGGGSQLLDDSASGIIMSDQGDISICSQTSEDSAVFLAQQQQQQQQQRHSKQLVVQGDGDVSRPSTVLNAFSFQQHQVEPPAAAVLLAAPAAGAAHQHRHSHSSHASTTGGAQAKPEKHRSVSEDDFERTGVLGQGAFGTVYDAIHKPSNTRVALKEIPRWRIRGKQMEEALKSEINVHRKLRHRNVVRLYSYYVTKACVVLVLERCTGGTLLQMLQRHNNEHDLREQQQQMDDSTTSAMSSRAVGLPEPIVSRAVRHVASALHYLHQQHVVHRDLKPENILLDQHGVAKLTDFGMSKVLKNQQQQAQEQSAHQQQQPRHSERGRSTFCGTLDYMAPEVIMANNNSNSNINSNTGLDFNVQLHAVGGGAITSRADVWSLGALALELLTGSPPFFDPSEAATMQRIQFANPRGLSPEQQQQHQQHSSASRGRLSVIDSNQHHSNNASPRYRDSASSPKGGGRRQQQQPTHRFSPDAVALLTRMLTKDPLQRPAIDEVLTSPWLQVHH